MSNPNKNWPRWIFASVSKHFYDNRDGIAIYVEGQHRDTKDNKDFFEIRVDGPYFTEYSKGYWRCYTEVNILVQSAMDNVNFHRIHTNVGIVAAAFTNAIPVYKYGSGDDDDDTLLGCMQLVSDYRGKERIQINHFGIIDKNVNLMQASVEGHYEIFL